MNISLPISKSIANRILLLQAIHGDPLMRVSTDMPDDVLVLYDALEKIRDTFGTPAQYAGSKESPFSLSLGEGRGEVSLYLKNCGTALRFLQVHLEQCYPGEPIELTGDERLMERKGKPTSQIDSARILHGLNVPVQENESPYITMSRRIKELYESYPSPLRGEPERGLEADWSAAAFWYEYVAIHGGALLLEGLRRETLQGDKMVASLYSKYFGVITSYTDEGAKIYKSSFPLKYDKVSIDFENIPDLYPAIAFTCERLHITLEATGTSRLRFKESNRLTAVRLHEVRNDHRMAMALMCADFPVSKEEQGCIGKSYPQFVENLQRVLEQTRDHTATTPSPKSEQKLPSISIGHITPIKGVNDEGKGKKFALSKLIHGTDTEYLWLHDDDIVRPQASRGECKLKKDDPDLIILPLRMESENEKPSLLEQLQIAEYAAIQELTMRTAKKNQAIMCSGANLIVRREVWLECESELHPEIPSGDDMFLLEAVKRKGYKIGVIDEEEYTAIVRPATNWRAFWRQRMRWAGKAPLYTDKDILDYGKFIVVANVLQLLFFPIIFIKFAIEYSLIRRRQMREHKIINYQLSISNFSIALLLEILYPIYLLICLIGGMNNKKEW